MYIDHLGNQWNNKEDMCKHYGVTHSRFNRAIKLGFSVEVALTFPRDIHPVVDPDNILHPDLRSMCEAWNQELGLYNRNRIRYKDKGMQFWLTYHPESTDKGLDIKYEVGTKFTTFTVTAMIKKDYKKIFKCRCSRCGNEITLWTFEIQEEPNCWLCYGKEPEWDGKFYSGNAALARAYGIKANTFAFRLSKGMTKEEACKLETKSISIKCKDHLGNEYNSRTEMAKAWKIDSKTLEGRLAANWDLEKALTTPVMIQERDYTKPLNSYDVGYSFGNFKIIEIVHENNGSRAYVKYKVQCNLCEGTRITQSNHFETTVCSTCGNKGKRFDGKYYGSDGNLCKAYNVSQSHFSTLRSQGISEEDICVHRPKRIKDTKAVEDHTGEKYSSKVAKCKEYGISWSVYKYRIKCGWSEEEALTTPVGKAMTPNSVTYNGKNYKSESEMCRDLGFDYESYRSSKSTVKSTNVEDIIEHMKNKKPLQVTYRGVLYENQKVMAETFGVKYSTYMQRIYMGWSIEESLGHAGRGLQVKDGNVTFIPKSIIIKDITFDSISEACRNFGVSSGAIYQAIRNAGEDPDLTEIFNKTIKRSLNTAVEFRGVKYKTHKELCDTYNMEVAKYYDLKRRGFSTAICLGLDERPNEKVRDHLGNEYNSTSEMCKYYNVGYKTFKNREELGLSLEDCLKTTEMVSYTDPNGRIWNNLQHMCTYWKIGVVTYKNRIAKGLSLNEVFQSSDIEVVGPNGITYSSYRELGRAYGWKSNDTYRIANRHHQLGWSIAEAVGIAGRGLETKIRNGDVLNTKVEVIPQGRQAHLYSNNGVKYYAVNIKDLNIYTIMSGEEIFNYDGTQKIELTFDEYIWDRERRSSNTSTK
jgi:hypothetical protein